jgi:fructose-1,6-bisphosphatase-3
LRKDPQGVWPRSEPFQDPQRTRSGKDQRRRKPDQGRRLLYVIDGGISKAYQKQTGIAGYTFIYNSRFMALAEHKPYSPLQPDGSQVFHTPVVKIVDTLPERMMVMDTDQGAEIVQAIDDIKQLVDAYRRGIIKEKY